MTPVQVGTYAESGGRGIHRLVTEPLALGEAFAGAPNASYGAWSARFGLHYLVDEQQDGHVTVLRKAAAGWERLAHAATLGEDPCYVALDPGETRLAVANYGSGSVALFGLDAQTGLPVEPPQLLQNQGHGPDAERQEGPHAHCALFSPDGRWLYQTDLGTDQVIAFRLDAKNGQPVERRIALAAPPGSGPRHLVFAGEQALLISELASSLTLLDVGEGALSVLQRCSTLPPGFEGKSLGGHLAVNAAGNRVYVTNRGHDSIGVFALEGGALSPLQHIPSRGASPRFFLLLERERRLIVAHEEAETLSAFEIAGDGTLAPLGEPLPVKGAAFLFIA